MEYNGLTFEQFDRYLTELKDIMDLNDGISNKLARHGQKYGDMGEFYFPTMAGAVINLLSLILEDKHDWIAHWCFERSFGQRCSLGDVTGTDGTVYPLDSVEHLWNILAAERRTKGAQ